MLDIFCGQLFLFFFYFSLFVQGGKNQNQSQVPVVCVDQGVMNSRECQPVTAPFEGDGYDGQGLPCITIFGQGLVPNHHHPLLQVGQTQEMVFSSGTCTSTCPPEPTDMNRPVWMLTCFDRFEMITFGNGPGVPPKKCLGLRAPTKQKGASTHRDTIHHNFNVFCAFLMFKYKT